MAEPNIILLGSGGHATVLLDAMTACGVTPTCFADPGRERGSEDFHGLPCIGDDEEVLKRKPDDIILVNGIGSTSRPRQRAALFKKFREAGYHFLTVIHPAVIIGSGATIGEGAQIMAGAVIQPYAVIGDNAIINTRAGIDHHAVIGESTHIAPGATICGDVKIGPESMVGAGATVIQGLKTGASSLIGAGMTLKADLAAGKAFI